MRLPALHTKELNVPGIMQAQQDYRLGEAKLAKYGREAEKEELLTGARQKAIGGDESALNTIASIEGPEAAQKILEYGSAKDERSTEKFMRDAPLVYRAIQDLGESPSPVQIEEAIGRLTTQRVDAANLGISEDLIAAARKGDPGALKKIPLLLAATAEAIQKQARGYETEPRKTRQVLRGGKPVGQEWNPTSGQWEDTTDMPVKLGVQAAELGGISSSEPVKEIPVENVPEGTDVSMATGAGGAVRNFFNTATDAFGWGLANPDNEKATRLLKRLSVETNLVLAASSVDGKVSNYIRERIAEMEASANKITQGDERTHKTIEELVISLSQRHNSLARMVNNPKGFSKKDVARAQASHAPLKELIDQYQTLLDNWGKSGEPAGETGLEETSTEDLKKQLGIE